MTRNAAPNPANPPLLSYEAGTHARPSLACRIAFACSIAATGIYAGLILFSRFVVGPAYRDLVSCAMRYSSEAKRYDLYKAIAVGMFLVLLAVLAVGAVCAIVAMIRHPALRRRAGLALGICCVVLAALAMTA